MLILQQKINRTFLSLRVSAFFEILFFFLVTTLVAFLLQVPFNYFKASLHPFCILVILMAAQYGTGEGLLADIVSVVIWLLGPLPERSIMQERYQYFFLLAKWPLLWFLSAVILGELRNKHLRETKELKKIVDQSQAKEAQMADAYMSLKNIKEHLELHVTSETQTILNGINAIIKLKQMPQEDFLKGAIDLISALLYPEKFSIYFLEHEELVKVAQKGWDPQDTFSLTFPKSSAIYQELIEKNNTLSLEKSRLDLLGKEGVIAVPITDKKTHKVLGMIKIEQIPFIRLKTAFTESVSLIGEWIGEAYQNLLDNKKP